MNSSAPTSILRRRKAERATGFDQLRTQGLALLQQSSRHNWTDHNLHDPGITILEQLCFALSEVGYRADFPVADLLCAPDGQIHFKDLALHPPHLAFACRATTAEDWWRLMLDRVAGLDDVHLVKHPCGLGGLWQLRLKLADGVASDGPAERDPRHLALRTFREERALGEDVDPEVLLVQDDIVELHADIELGGMHDAGQVLAEVFHRAASFIAGATPQLSRRELRAQGQTLEQIHDGPQVQHGFAVSDERHRGRHHAQQGAGAPANTVTADLRQALHVADVQAAVSQVAGVRQLNSFALARPGRPPTTGSLLAADADHALRLVIPGAPPGHGPLVGLHVQMRRRNQDIAVDLGELWRRVQDLQAAERAQHSRHGSLLAQDEADGRPQGSHREPAPYLSVQHHFPATFGLGRHGVPPQAGPQRQAQAQQMRAYLALFDQVLANARAQLSHLHELFSVTGGGAAGSPRKSYWWERLDEHKVPGLAPLLVGSPQDIEASVLSVLDLGAPRKHHLLDHLLALHGEKLSQSAVRLYCAHLDAEELDALLLANKTAWLADVVRLGQHRAGAFDDSKPLWPQDGAAQPDEAQDNTSGLARRVCLLLGFVQHWARPLTPPLWRRGLRIDESAQGATPAPATLLAAVEVLVGAPPAALPAGPAGSEVEAGAAQVLPAELFRAGAAKSNFRLLDITGEDGKRASALAVGPGVPHASWTLGPYATRDAARRAAGALRHALRQANDACEGMHLVEHLLLRPVCADTPHHDSLRVPDGFYAMRLSAVMPCWTVRTAQPGFRRLAQETLRINTPAHLQIQLLWLDFAPMQIFERAFGQWLLARRQWCAEASQVQAQALDRAACRVLRLLQHHGRRARDA